MSEWFRPIPSALDAVMYSVKVSTFKCVPSKTNMPSQFQQEMMAAQIMALRSRCQQQRVVIDRLKTENSELKKYCLGHLDLSTSNPIRSCIVSLQIHRRIEEWNFPESNAFHQCGI